MRSGIAWNVVRASWFAQNFSESFMLDGILAGELVLPAGDTLEPFIDADDIADVAVAALTEAGHRNKLLEIRHRCNQFVIVPVHQVPGFE